MIFYTQNRQLLQKTNIVLKPFGEDCVSLWDILLWVQLHSNLRYMHSS